MTALTQRGTTTASADHYSLLIDTHKYLYIRFISYFTCEGL